MTIKNIFQFIVFIFLINGCKKPIYKNPDTVIIPQPKVQFKTPDIFVLNNDVGLIYDQELKTSSMFLKDYIEKGSAIKLKNKSDKTTINFIKVDTIANAEAYKLKITRSNITIEARTD